MKSSNEQQTAIEAQPLPDLDFADLDGAAEAATPTEPRRKWRRLLMVLVVLALLGTAAGIYRLRGNQTESAAAYKTTAVTRGALTQSVTASGSISPIKTVTVGSQVSGQITDLMADYNSHVTNGQVVAQLDPSTYQQYLVQAEAELANAKAAVSLAQLSYRRAKQLDEEKAKPHSEFEKAEVELQQAEATAKSREAALKKAQVDLERTTIYSPIDGVVISRAVDVGQTVAASFNAPTLFTVAKDLREMRIQAAVSEADIGGVNEGETVHFTVDAYPNLTFTGRVTQVRFEPSTNQNVVTYASIVDVRNDDLKLRPGMTANATIITAQRQNALRIPNAALRFTPAGSANSAAATPATTGADSRAPVNDLHPTPTAASGPGQPLPGMAGQPAGLASNTVGSPPPSEAGTDHGSGAQRTVYVLENGPGTAGAALRAVNIRIGISDGSQTEVLDGLAENDQVVTGTATKQEQVAAASSRTRNPFSMGGPGGPPR